MRLYCQGNASLEDYQWDHQGGRYYTKKQTNQRSIKGVTQPKVIVTLALIMCSYSIQAALNGEWPT